MDCHRGTGKAVAIDSLFEDFEGLAKDLILSPKFDPPKALNRWIHDLQKCILRQPGEIGRAPVSWRETGGTEEAL